MIGYGTLAEMEAASDLVVVGTVESSSPPLTIPETDDPEAGYTEYNLAVEEVLSGGPVAEVKVTIQTHDHGCRLEIGNRPTPVPGDRGVWFLRQLEPEFEIEGYGLTSEQGMMLTPSEGVTTADAEWLRFYYSSETDPILAEVERRGSFQAIVDHLREP
jgi:hypothetical protein